MSFNKDGANAHRVNSYTHQTLEKMAKNGVLVYSGTLLKLVPGSSGNMVLDIAGPGDLIEGVSEQAGQFPVDNETTLQRNIIYKPFVWDHTYKMRLIPGQTITKADVGKFIQMDADQYLDTGTISTLQGQFRIEGLFEGGKVAEVRILQWIPDPVGAPPQDIYITGVVPTATPGSYTVNMSDGSSFVADLSALLDNTDSQKIILGPGATEISITTKDGTTVYNTIDLATLVKNAETQTTLDSVEIVGNQLIVKYTGEDGAQQVKSVDATVFITDVNVQNAILTNPSAGVWNLVITETDGSTHTVNVSDLIKIITANTSSAELLGDGTAGDPLRVNVKISTQAGNGLILLADGLYAQVLETTTVIDEPSINSFRYTNEIGAQVIITLVKSVAVTGAGTTLTVTANGVAGSYDILPLIKAGETDTTLDDVKMTATGPTTIQTEVTYTGEDGTPQVKTGSIDIDSMIKAGETITTLQNIANGYRYTNEAGATADVIYDVIDQGTNNPKLTITVGGVLVKTIDLNQNDIQINNAGSDFDLTDDTLSFVETNGDTASISFAKYNVSITTQPNGDQLIYQNGNLLGTIYKNAVDIAIADAGGYFASGNVEGALQELALEVMNKPLANKILVNNKNVNTGTWNFANEYGDETTTDLITIPTLPTPPAGKKWMAEGVGSFWANGGGDVSPSTWKGQFFVSKNNNIQFGNSNNARSTSGVHGIRGNNINNMELNASFETEVLSGDVFSIIARISYYKDLFPTPVGNLDVSNYVKEMNINLYLADI